MEGVGIPWAPPSKEEAIARLKLLSLIAKNVQDDEGVKDLLKMGNCCPKVLQKLNVTCDAYLFFDEDLGYYFFTFNNKEEGEVITLKSYIEHLGTYSWSKDVPVLSNPKDSLMALLQLLESREENLPKLYFLINCLRGSGLADNLISEVSSNPIGHADEQGFIVLKDCCCDVRRRREVEKCVEENCNGMFHYITMSSILSSSPAEADIHNTSSSKGKLDEGQSSLTSVVTRRTLRYVRKFMHVPPNYNFV